MQLSMSQNMRWKKYDKLGNVIRKFSIEDIVVVIGDCNAKVDIDNTELQDIIGENGIWEKKWK